MSVLGADAIGHLALGHPPDRPVTFFVAASASYSVSGVAAAFKVSEIAAATSFTVTGNAAPLTPRLVSNSGSFTLTGFSINVSVLAPSAAGSYVITGNVAELNRDFVNWLPSTEPSSGWTAGALPSSTWTPASTPSTTWTVDAAQYIAPPESV
jgi:hypothetical protein